jgi:hypothetical protein
VRRAVAISVRVVIARATLAKAPKPVREECSGHAVNDLERRAESAPRDAHAFVVSVVSVAGRDGRVVAQPQRVDCARSTFWRRQVDSYIDNAIHAGPRHVLDAYVEKIARLDVFTQAIQCFRSFFRR